MSRRESRRRGRANDSEGVRHLPSSWEEAENGGQGHSAGSVGVKEIWGEGASGTLELQRALETEIVDMLRNQNRELLEEVRRLREEREQDKGSTPSTAWAKVSDAPEPPPPQTPRSSTWATPMEADGSRRSSKVDARWDSGASRVPTERLDA